MTTYYVNLGLPKGTPGDGTTPQAPAPTLSALPTITVGDHEVRIAASTKPTVTGADATWDSDSRVVAVDQTSLDSKVLLGVGFPLSRATAVKARNITESSTSTYAPASGVPVVTFRVYGTDFPTASGPHMAGVMALPAPVDLSGMTHIVGQLLCNGTRVAASWPRLVLFSDEAGQNRIGDALVSVNEADNLTVTGGDVRTLKYPVYKLDPEQDYSEVRSVGYEYAIMMFSSASTNNYDAWYSLVAFDVSKMGNILTTGTLVRPEGSDVWSPVLFMMDDGGVMLGTQTLASAPTVGEALVGYPSGTTKLEVWNPVIHPDHSLSLSERTMAVSGTINAANMSEATISGGWDPETFTEQDGSTLIGTVGAQYGSSAIQVSLSAGPSRWAMKGVSFLKWAGGALGGNVRAGDLDIPLLYCCGNGASSAIGAATVGYGYTKVQDYGFNESNHVSRTATHSLPDMYRDLYLGRVMYNYPRTTNDTGFKTGYQLQFRGGMEGLGNAGPTIVSVDKVVHPYSGLYFRDSNYLLHGTDFSGTPADLAVSLNGRLVLEGVTLPSGWIKPDMINPVDGEVSIVLSNCPGQQDRVITRSHSLYIDPSESPSPGQPAYRMDMNGFSPSTFTKHYDSHRLFEVQGVAGVPLALEWKTKRLSSDTVARITVGTLLGSLVHVPLDGAAGEWKTHTLEFTPTYSGKVPIILGVQFRGEEESVLVSRVTQGE